MDFLCHALREQGHGTIESGVGSYEFDVLRSGCKQNGRTLLNYLDAKLS
jgi:hypothetical protein